ncbi:MAG: endo-1,4-beta-xylanase [Phycisphaerales bacterium]|nr:endo-1,4-beta-xylanase [Phycisphaerales bacterium]
MLRFAVFDERGPGRDFVLRHAHLFGADDAPLAAQAAAAGGIIECTKAGTEAAGLALQFPVLGPGGESLGDLTLRTCLLPPRPEPYLLTLELARRRIMMILNKLEQWGLFDLPGDDAVMKQFEEARHLFAAALVAQRGTGAGDHAGFALEADRTARRALYLAVDAGERLTQVDAERQLGARFRGETYARTAAHQAESIAADRVLPEGAVKSSDSTGVVLQAPPVVGCAVNPAQFSGALAQGAAPVCDFVSIPMRWSDMEPTEGRYSFAKTDRWIEWAVRTARVPVWGGPILDFRTMCVPEWLFIWEHDYETLRELVYEHLKQIVTRYRRTVTRWTVASGLHVNQGFALALERMMDLTRLSVLLLKKLQPGAKVQVEVSEPFGEHYATNRRSIPPLAYVDMIGQAGIAIDALGIKLQIGQPGQGRSARDLLVLSDLLDRYAQFDRPIVVSAAGAPSGRLGAGDPEDPGSWRGAWTPEHQRDWLVQITQVAASKPYVVGVCWQDLYDGPQADMPLGGLLTESGTPKPAAAALAELRRDFRSQRVAIPALPVAVKP